MRVRRIRVSVQLHGQGGRGVTVSRTMVTSLSCSTMSSKALGPVFMSLLTYVVTLASWSRKISLSFFRKAADSSHEPAPSTCV